MLYKFNSSYTSIIITIYPFSILLQNALTSLKDSNLAPSGVTTEYT